MNKRTDALHISLPCDRYTLFSLVRKLGAAAVLESASFEKGKARYSIVMYREAFRVVQDEQGVAFIIDGKRTPYTPKVPYHTMPYRGGAQLPVDILDALEYVASQNEPPKEDVPLPAAGIGYLGYEFCARCDAVTLSQQTDELSIPESAFMVGHIYIVFDHFTEMLHFFALNYAEHAIDLQAELDALRARLDDLDFSYLEKLENPCPCHTITDLAQSEKEYKANVSSIKKHIVDGDLLQAVPSRRLILECGTTALEAYRRLRSENPSPYLFYLDFGTMQFVGSSPESLVRVRSGKANIHPIAGTRRRGTSDAEDEALKAELLVDPKERAEHLMLVDLARNDLGRVCTAGSVTVPQFMECSKFSHVMHIVSNVEGTVLPEVSTVQVIRAVFPAGTVSGAPKISALHILSKLEKHSRRFYAGGVGYIQANGDADFCIAIRCALKQGTRWTLQAGGGIVADSEPAREWEETNEKLGALRSMLEQTPNGGKK